MNKIDIKAIRKKAGFTQEQLARKLKIADCTLAHYESGIRKITLETFLKILEVCKLEISLDEIEK